MRYSIIILSAFLLISCETKKHLPINQIAEIDNIIVHEDKSLRFIDSLLQIYPDSEYLHGLRIMMLSNIGKYYEAQHEQVVLAEKGINGTFTYMGWAHAEAFKYYRKYKSFSEYSIPHFQKAIDIDHFKVNIWARMDLFMIYNEIGLYNNAEHTILDAYQINPENSYILEELTKFYIDQGSIENAKIVIEKINPNYYPIGIDSLRTKIENYKEE